MRNFRIRLPILCLLIVSALAASDKVRLRDLPAIVKTAPPLTSFAGKPVVLVFWAVWCGPCAAELRELERVARAEKISFVGIAVESPEKQALMMVERTGVTFANYLDGSSEFADALGISGVPALFVIDSAGYVVWSQSGYANFPGQDLRLQIDKLTKSKKE